MSGATRAVSEDRADRWEGRCGNELSPCYRVWRAIHRDPVDDHERHVSWEPKGPQRAVDPGVEGGESAEVLPTLRERAQLAWSDPDPCRSEPIHGNGADRDGIDRGDGRRRGSHWEVDRGPAATGQGQCPSDDRPISERLPSQLVQARGQEAEAKGAARVCELFATPSPVEGHEGHQCAGYRCSSGPRNGPRDRRGSPALGRDRPRMQKGAEQEQRKAGESKESSQGGDAGK